MLYHITYTKRDGSTEVGRVNAGKRSEALSSAAIKFGVRRTAIKSAVALPSSWGRTLR